ncbi:MAG: MBL fold metallo-hydrolase [Verrucomicrobiota bacterium]
MSSPHLFSLLAIASAVCCCSTYHPLHDPDLRKPIGDAHGGVKITFLGNSTLYVTDGRTSMLVDGFLSRPSGFKTLFGKIGPEPRVIEDELRHAGIVDVTAVLVGHAHHDHALDATVIADRYEATVIGSESFARIYEGSHDTARRSILKTVAASGDHYEIGEFTVTFVPSDHVGSHSPVQSIVEGSITRPLRMPAHYSRFKCGQVFVLHIAHRDGNMVVTTTAGAKEGQLEGMQADVIFLGVGMLSKEAPDKRNTYWAETVRATNPKVVIPVHWDNFARKLSRGLAPMNLVGNPKEIMAFVKSEACGRQVRVLDLRESVWLKGRAVYCP